MNLNFIRLFIIFIVSVFISCPILASKFIAQEPKEVKSVLGEEYLVENQCYNISSPNEKIKVKIEMKDKIYYSVFCNSKEIIAPSPISLTVNNGMKLGKNPKIINAKRRRVEQTINPVIKEKRRVIVDHYNEIVLNFKGEYGLIFRIYNDGMAYRLFTKFEGKIKIISEEVSFNFAKNHSLYVPFVKQFQHCFEANYTYLPMNKITSEQMGFIPVLVDVKEGPKIVIAEADLDDYPGMFLAGSDDGSPSLSGKFAPYRPLKEKMGQDIITERADYLALTEGNRVYPWRVIGIVEKDGNLIESDLIFRLAKALQLKDTSWIQPGKVAWDWWNARNIYGVDFKSGINTETYKYYINFAANHNIEYVLIDGGWYQHNLFNINPNLDMGDLLQYAKQKNVGIILWCAWISLEGQLQPALDTFENWGIKGIKIDFMDRDDQEMVNFFHRVAKEAAIRHLLVDFHGAYKPTGLRRTYPNVITREGVVGLEHNKTAEWEGDATPENDLTIPFIRMFAGPMDYTPGAMNNAQKKNFRHIYERPMSQGTRVHQLAMYVIYESPLQMLADSPSNYEREPEIMRFLSHVPTVWDETKVLDAKVSAYVIVARKNGKEWYVGAMTDWTPRTLQIDFDFLERGNYIAEIYSDGPNASRYASDFKRTVKTVSQNESLHIELAPGGGWVARIHKPKD